METQERMVYTVPEMAKQLHISVPKAYELVHRKDFPSVRVTEKRIVIPIDGLKNWLTAQSRETA